jgi:hypothetical protein
MAGTWLQDEQLMAKVSVQEIRQVALEILAQTAEGVRYSQLVREILQARPEANENAVHGVVYDLPSHFPDRVVRPARGLYALAKVPVAETPAVV